MTGKPRTIIAEEIIESYEERTRILRSLLVRFAQAHARNSASDMDDLYDQTCKLFGVVSILDVEAE